MRPVTWLRRRWRHARARRDMMRFHANLHGEKSADDLRAEAAIWRRLDDPDLAALLEQTADDVDARETP